MKSTLDYIEEKWGTLQNRVAQCNARGFLDLARYCEDIVAQIFNILYGISLVNLNHRKSRFPVVDLGDPAQGVYLQVTTLQSHQCRKIATTAARFSQRYAGNRLILFFCVYQTQSAIHPRLGRGYFGAGQRRPDSKDPRRRSSGAGSDPRPAASC